MRDLAQQLSGKNKGFILFIQPMFSGITLLKTSCIFECCYEFVFGENRIEQYFSGTRNQSSAHCAGVVKVRATEGARQRGPAGAWGSSDGGSGPVSPSLSFPHGDEMFVEIKCWSCYITSFIHQTCYSASVSDQCLIHILIICPVLCIFNVPCGYWWNTSISTWNPLCIKSIILSAPILLHFTDKQVCLGKICLWMMFIWQICDRLDVYPLKRSLYS